MTHLNDHRLNGEITSVEPRCDNEFLVKAPVSAVSNSWLVNCLPFSQQTFSPFRSRKDSGANTINGGSDIFKSPSEPWKQHPKTEAAPWNSAIINYDTYTCVFPPVTWRILNKSVSKVLLKSAKLSSHWRGWMWLIMYVLYQMFVHMFYFSDVFCFSWCIVHGA